MISLKISNVIIFSLTVSRTGLCSRSNRLSKKWSGQCWCKVLNMLTISMLRIIFYLCKKLGLTIPEMDKWMKLTSCFKPTTCQYPFFRVTQRPQIGRYDSHSFAFKCLDVFWCMPALLLISCRRRIFKRWPFSVCISYKTWSRKCWDEATVDCIR